MKRAMTKIDSQSNDYLHGDFHSDKSEQVMIRKK